jgi:hypothetical protein
MRLLLKKWRMSVKATQKKKTEEQQIDQLMKSGYFKTRKEAEEAMEGRS